MDNGIPQRAKNALKEHMAKYKTTEDDYVIFVRDNGSYAFLLKTYYEKLSNRKKNKLIKGCCFIKL